MNYLFIHQNAPGQWRHIARRLAADPSNRVVIIGRHQRVEIPGAQFILYKPKRVATEGIHHYVRPYEDAVLHGQEVARILMALKAQGFRPDLICAHPAWGEALFVKDVYPDVPLVAYAEFFYRSRGADYGFGAGSGWEEFGFAPATPDGDLRVRAKNATLLTSLEAADYGLTPTEWQASQHPAFIRDKMTVIHEGVDTTVCWPDPDATFTLPDGRILSRGQPVVTYVARNLEPYRGFPIFMTAMAELLARRPDVEVVVVGGDEVSYGTLPPDGRPWREFMLGRVQLDRSRIHFLGKVPYEQYLRILQISSVHTYLTVPFVLSWSLIEAMACGCAIVASKTPPVEEVIEHDNTGFLTDFFDASALSAAIETVLANPRLAEGFRSQALERAVMGYDLNSVCLPRLESFLSDILGASVRSRERASV